MKEAGIRQARQNLTALLDDVRKGHEVTITDRGRPVARLVPPHQELAQPYRGRAAFRKRMPRLLPAASAAILEDRADRG